MMHFGYFDTARKGNYSATLTPTVVGGRRPFPLKSALKVTPLRKTPTSTDIRKRAEKVQLCRILSRPQAFQRGIDGVRTLPLEN